MDDDDDMSMSMSMSIVPLRKKKPSMKRRRPWASKTLVAATVLMGLWRGSNDVNGLPVGFAQESARAGEMFPRQVESNVTPSPSPVSTDMKQPPSKNMVEVTKESFPVNVDMVLTVESTVDLNQLIGDVQQVMEKYLLDGLLGLEDSFEDLHIRIQGVLLAVTLLVRRSLLHLRQLQFQQPTTRDITLEVEGSVQYDAISRANTLVLLEELETLLTTDNLNRALLDSDVDGVLGVPKATIVKVEDRDGTNTKVNNDSTTNNMQETEPPLDEDDNGLQRPPLLSIVFGFSLVAIAAAGLVAYAYILYRKRKKQLARNKQRMESIQYHTPNKMSPTKRPQPPQVPVVSTASFKGSNDSDESSYKGIDSVESGGDEEPSDSFARELQLAASLDQQAWENFQRKKGALDRSQVIKKSERANRQPRTPEDSINAYGGSSQWTKSFPYGDERQSVIEEGVECTPDDVDDDLSNWEPYKNNNNLDDSRVSNTSSNNNNNNKAEEKKEEHGGVFRKQKQQQQPLSVSTQSIERDAAIYGKNNDPAVENKNTSPLVQEVERLSRYVQRYEKRKERRLHRGHLTPSSDTTSSSNNNNYSNASSSQSENISYLNNMRASPHAQQPSSKTTSKPNGFGQIGHQAPRISTFTGEIQDTSQAAFSEDTLQVSDSEASEYTEEDRSLKGQRLGITPFSVQKPEERSSPDVMSPNMQKRAQAEAMRARSGGGTGRRSLPMDEQPGDRRRRPQSEGGGRSLSNLRFNSAMLDRNPPGLSDLRANTAILDTSQSDVNLGFLNGPYGPDDEVDEPQPSPRIPRLRTPRGSTSRGSDSAGPSPNKKFNKLFNLFEERPNEAIFPPDQHWQYGVSNTPKSNSSVPR